jgi:hypothetical protein
MPPKRRPTKSTSALDWAPSPDIEQHVLARLRKKALKKRKKAVVSMYTPGVRGLSKQGPAFSYNRGIGDLARFPLSGEKKVEVIPDEYIEAKAYMDATMEEDVDRFRKQALTSQGLMYAVPLGPPDANFKRSTRFVAEPSQGDVAIKRTEFLTNPGIFNSTFTERALAGKNSEGVLAQTRYKPLIIENLELLEENDTAVDYTFNKLRKDPSVKERGLFLKDPQTKMAVAIVQAGKFRPGDFEAAIRDRMGARMGEAPPLAPAAALAAAPAPAPAAKKGPPRPPRPAKAPPVPPNPEHLRGGAREAPPVPPKAASVKKAPMSMMNSLLSRIGGTMDYGAGPLEGAKSGAEAPKKPKEAPEKPKKPESSSAKKDPDDPSQGVKKMTELEKKDRATITSAEIADAIKETYDYVASRKEDQSRVHEAPPTPIQRVHETVESGDGPTARLPAGKVTATDVVNFMTRGEFNKIKDEGVRDIALKSAKLVAKAFNSPIIRRDDGKGEMSTAYMKGMQMAEFLRGYLTEYTENLGMQARMSHKAMMATLYRRWGGK